MNESRPAKTRSGQPWLTNNRKVCLALIVLATLYTILQPRLEQWTGLDLPDVVQREREDVRDATPRPGEGSAAESSGPTESSDSFELKETGRNVFQSPAGLVYTMGPNREHRIDHIMRHAQDQPNRPVHGVFDANDRNEVLKLLDDAWVMVREKSREVRKEQGDNGLDEFTVDMPKRVGYVGGEQGGRQNNPATKRLKLITDGNRVITAYPTWPPR